MHQVALGLFAIIMAICWVGSLTNRLGQPLPEVSLGDIVLVIPRTIFPAIFMTAVTISLIAVIGALVGIGSLLCLQFFLDVPTLLDEVAAFPW